MTIRTRALCSLGVLGAGLALAFSGLPLNLPSICLFKRFTGLPCASCGMTHAFCALSHGHFHDATSYHLATIPLAIVIAAATTLMAVEAVMNRPLLGPLWNKAGSFVMWSMIVLLAAGWAVNLAKAWHG